MNTEKAVIEHYTHADLAEHVLGAARKTAVDPARLTVADIGLYDEFHIGGRHATKYFMPQLNLSAGMKVLDVGCGIGGAARFAVHTYAVQINGIDLTPDFIAAAEALSDSVGMNGNPVFQTASALSLPFEEGAFDAAYTIHAAMNIEDKAGMYREAARVLKLGAVFGIYDIMAGPEVAGMVYPAPWAQTQDTSFLVAPADVQKLLEDAGFEMIHSESRRDFALETFKREEGAAPSPHRPPDFPQKRVNLRHNVEQNRCAPHIIICRRL